MKFLKFIPVILFSMFVFTSCEEDDNLPKAQGNKTETGDNANKNLSSDAVYARLEFPKLKGGNSLVLVHKVGTEVNYSVEFDTDKKSQRWSCYQLNKALLSKRTTRYDSDTDQYPEDPLLPAEYQWKSDPFWGSGYDHGHICPSADRLNSAEHNYQTFFLTNMMPQTNKFNAGIWAEYEAYVRNMANVTDRTLYVCKGGTIDKSSDIYGYVHQMIIPKYYFMALLSLDNGQYNAIGLWFDHQKKTCDAVSIDRLEQLTGIDFFCNLPDAVEDQVESNFDRKFWKQ